MLETIRAFSVERLDAASDRDAVIARHYDHFADLVRRHGDERVLGGLDRKSHIALLAADNDNLNAALALAVQREDAERALSLAGGLGRYWLIQRRYAEGVRWLDAALALPGAGSHPALQVRAMCARVRCLWAIGRGTEQMAGIEAAERLARDLGDPLLLTQVLQIRAGRESSAARLDAASATGKEALRLAVAVEDVWEIAESSAVLTLASQTITELRDRLDQAVPLLADAGNEFTLAILRSGAAYVALFFGDERLARELAEAAFPAVRALDEPYSWAMVCGNFGLAALLTEDADAASDAFREQLRLCAEMRVLPLASEGMLGLAAVSASRGDDDRAARLLGAASAHSYGQQQDAIRTRLDREFFEFARKRLGAHEWDAAVAEGAKLGFDDAIAFALGESTM
jgi:hypothetical protein